MRCADGQTEGMGRPLIGITTYREQAQWGTWHVPAVLLPAAYADAVAAAGGEPVLLPTGAVSAEVVGRLDGLVLAGGADVDPARYGRPAGPHTTVLRPERDATELAALEAALERDLPLLAVCRGMQLLNVALGGDLVQHLPDLEDTGIHDPGAGLFQRREVRTQHGTRLHDLLGPSAQVACHHHQALHRIAADLTPSAWAEDGVVEAVEATDRRFCLAVQWHPEETADRRLFTALVAAAAG
ncbi:MAG: gamma-glutamyl-gamma-aminobutyrate hydrolase family protein [Blastococcus sp.]|nr:gamma-glutamyl-gamma-aminobutyrate hydrolase family protein [Blastococcus sp.]